jgi:hypothetical protein
MFQYVPLGSAPLRYPPCPPGEWLAAGERSSHSHRRLREWCRPPHCTPLNGLLGCATHGRKEKRTVVRPSQYDEVNLVENVFEKNLRKLANGICDRRMELDPWSDLQSTFQQSLYCILQVQHFSALLLRQCAGHGVVWGCGVRGWSVQ